MRLPRDRNITFLLLRHASAGRRFRDPLRDRFRGLDRVGRRQAEAVATSLVSRQPPVILTSAARRCVETVEPLARLLGLELEGRPELFPGTTRRALTGLLTQCQPGTVLCTHREVMELLVGVDGAPGMAGALLMQSDSETRRPIGTLPPPTLASDPRRWTATPDSVVRSVPMIESVGVRGGQRTAALRMHHPDDQEERP